MFKMSNYILPSYVEFLESKDLTLNGLKQLLEEDSSWVNQVTECRESPLFIVLCNGKCSSDIVKLLLQYNANIDFQDTRGRTCLFKALFLDKDEAVIKALLENGAKVDIRDENKRPPLCFAFHCTCATMETLKMLLESKCPPYACGIHGSLMHCAMGRIRPVLKFTEDFFDLLIVAGGNFNSVNANGQYPLCLALQIGGKDAQCIELLLSKGCSLNACKKHDSPMLCATDCNYYSYLKTDVVQLLLKKKASMNKKSSGGTALQLALLRTSYDFEAIKLMVDHSTFDVNASFENHGNLLHVALKNPFCKLSVLQLLIGKGVRVNDKNKDGQTTMELALKTGLYCDILKLLFVWGARIDLSMNYGTIYSRASSSFLEFALDEYKSNPCQENRNRFKLLIKCFCLENIDFHIQSLRLDHSEHSHFLRFTNQCRNELQRMELQNLFIYHTLRDFARRSCLTQNIASNFLSAMKSYELNQLLQILSGNVFPIYMDIVVSKTGRVSMETKLKEVPVYTINNYTPSSSTTERCIVLDYSSVLHITQYISNDDLMQLIIAYFVR